MPKVTITIEDQEGKKNLSITADFSPKPIMLEEELTPAQALGMELIMQSKRMSNQIPFESIIEAYICDAKRKNVIDENIEIIRTLLNDFKSFANAADYKLTSYDKRS